MANFGGIVPEQFEGRFRHRGSVRNCNSSRGNPDGISFVLAVNLGHRCALPEFRKRGEKDTNHVGASAPLNRGLDGR